MVFTDIDFDKPDVEKTVHGRAYNAEINVLFKLVVIVLLLVVVFSLGQALFFLIRDEGKSDRMMKSLTWRIGLSVFIFILLLIGQAMGLIQPHGL